MAAPGTTIERRRARTAAAAVVLGLALGLATLGGGEAAGAPPRANIILVTTDDQTAESAAHMRRLQLLYAERGTKFTNMVASFPLCCPARATWITGQYAHNHGVLDNQERNGGGYESLRDPGRVMPVWLDAAGYDTALFGKWLHDYRSLQRPPGWDVWNALIAPTVTRYYDYEIADSRGGKVTYGHADADYLSDVLTRRYAIPYLYAHANDRDPFFVHLSYTAPHWGKGRGDEAGRRCANGKPFRFETARAKPAPRHAGRFAGEPLPEVPSFDEEDVSDKPDAVAGREPLPRSVKREITKRYRCELASLLAVDEGLKQIDAALEQTGLASSTYVIYTSDNGYMHGEHRIRAEKVQPYEESILVPFVIRGPFVPAGLEIDDPVANTDLVSTIMDLAGVPQAAGLGRTIDGVSLVPSLFGARHPNRAILIEGKRPPRETAGGRVLVPSFAGVRTRRYTYVEHYRAEVPALESGFGLPIGIGPVRDRELYDLARDPYELESRDSGGVYAAARSALAATLAQLRPCAGAGCVLEPAVPGPAR